LIDYGAHDSMAAMATAEIRRTACSLDCFDACGIVAEVADDRIVRIGGDPSIRSRAAPSATRSTITCATASTIPTASCIPPQVERALAASGVDDALDLIAEKLTRAKERHGTLAVLYHKGNGSFAASRSWASASSTSTAASRKPSAGSAVARPIMDDAVLRSVRDPRPARSRRAHAAVPDLGPEPA